MCYDGYPHLMVAAVIPKERYGTTWELIIRMINLYDHPNKHLDIY
jgi:hypothetical protein